MLHVFVRLFDLADPNTNNIYPDLSKGKFMPMANVLANERYEISRELHLLFKNI